MTTATPTFNLDAILNDVHDGILDVDTTTTPTTPEPYIAAVPVNSLFADPLYQRTLDEVRVDKMAAAYQVALVGIIEVSARPDGRYAILDGQHRVAVAKSVAFGTPNQNPHVPCRIHTGLTGADEATLYHQLNTTRRQLTGWDRWVARRGAGDPDVLAIEASARRNNLIIGAHVGPNVLRSTQACERVVTLGGIALLDEVLSVIRAAWPADQAALENGIIQGVGFILTGYTRDELDTTRLVTQLGTILPRQLTARARAAAEVHKGTAPRLVGHVMIDLYNGPRAGRVEPFLVRVKPQSTTVTDKHRKEKEHRALVFAWAEETSWPGRRDRMSAKLAAAYSARHDAGADQ